MNFNQFNFNNNNDFPNQQNLINNFNNMNYMNQNRFIYNNNFLNNSFCLPNNNILYNNYGFNNFNNFNNFQNNMMMMNYNRNLMMMNNNIIQNNQKINMMKSMIAQKKRKEFMDKILNESNNQNDNIDDNINDIDEMQNNQNENPQINEALNEVAKEELIQKQKFENYQPPENQTFEEVDPTFMHSFISDRELFDGNGHNLIGKWAHGENRGGRPYNPPDGWIGFGLNVIGKYDNGNNDWLACNGRPGEWCVAYHGVCSRNTSDEAKKIIKIILEQNLKPGSGQAFSGYNDDNHPGQKVGVGVYCSPNPTVIDGYAGTMEVDGHKYRIGFMLRVKPDKIRFSNSQKDYWVLNAGNGDFSEMRPYRFLIKKAS